MAGAKSLLKAVAHRAANAAGLYLQPGGGRSPIPDLAELQRDRSWRAPKAMTAVRGVDLAGQTAFIDTLMTPDVVAALTARDIYAEAERRSGDRGGFGGVEAAMLYALVRARRPGRIVQYGTWISAAVIGIAAEDAGYRPEVTVVDPSPRPWLIQARAAGRIAILELPPQRAPMESFTRLGAGDVLFIDTNHAVKTGGEVNHFILDVLPALAPGVLVHVHGVNFPYDYGRRLLSGDYAFAGEGTLLHAFLACNDRYRIAASLSMLHYGARDALRARFPLYAPEADEDGLAGAGGGDCPTSIWLERAAEGATP